MGGCVSGEGGSASSSSFSTIRLVHFNGYVEDFDHPLSVGQVIGKPPKQYLCSPAELVSAGPRPLAPDTQLQPGRIYFVLPLSALQNEFSPLDMSSVAKRLTARAKSVRSADAVPSPTPLPSPSTSPSPSLLVRSSSDRSPAPPEIRRELMAYGEAELFCRTRGGSWKPILDSITEISFAPRTESDLSDTNSLPKKS